MCAVEGEGSVEEAGEGEEGASYTHLCGTAKTGRPDKKRSVQMNGGQRWSGVVRGPVCVGEAARGTGVPEVTESHRQGV